MEVIYKDFKITKLKDSYFYNLEKMETINGKDGKRQEYKINSNGIPFHVCIEKIVDYELRNLDGVYTINEYLDIYKNLVNELSKAFE